MFAPVSVDMAAIQEVIGSLEQFPGRTEADFASSNWQ
jgi:hypothetical protein